MGYYSEGRRESIAYFLAIIMTLGAISPSLPFGPDDAIPNPFSCVDIEGAIIEKEHDDEGHKLYVELYGVANLDSWNGYIVYVSNKTYTDYEVGYTYEQRVCDLLEYEDIKTMYFDLVDIGILIPT